MSLQTGVRLGDRYELVSRIAAGGMGEVWRAQDSTLQRTVAVKVLRSEYTGDATFLSRFRTEARNTAMLSHVNIAQVYDYGEAMAEGEHVAYLVMELVEGEPLSTVLAREARQVPPKVLDILGQTAAGLGVAHRAGVVHRDVKPANLIVRPDRVVKITDFGISRAADHVPLTGTGMVIGTAQYLSPEQAMGRPVTPASDVYALGVVGYEALAGRRPFEGESSVSVALAHVNQQPAPLPADVPGPIRDLILRSMSKDPRQRFPDGAAFAGAIHAVARGRSLPTHGASGSSGPGMGTTRAIRSGGPAAGAAVGAVGVGAAAGTAGAAGGKPPTARMPAVAPPRARPPGRAPSYAPPRQPAKSRARTGQYVTVLVLVALLIALGLLAVFIVQSDNDNGQTATPSDGAVSSAAQSDGGAQDSGEPPAEEPPPEPELVPVDTAAYFGEPVDEVEAALEQLDLVVDRRGVDVTPAVLEAAGLEDQPIDKDAVIGTLPTQTEVPAGSTVTVFFANKAYEPDSNNGNGNGDEGDDG
ncbi:MAG: serine/threonine protein kinase [Geodermatophilaceae bacterium]|nr:serine/threonine protein kinase [Geodermatophilaceae bacterium]